MTDPVLDLARQELRDHAGSDFAAISYMRAQSVPAASLTGYFGFYAVTTIADCGAGRFDFSDDTGECFPGFIIEAFGADCETVEDLVGWSLVQPERVFSMFGRCAMLGITEALAPSTYTCGLPLDVHRTPLAWLQAGCRGAAIVTPHLAAGVLRDIPHGIAGRDDAHTRDLIELAKSAVPAFDITKFLTASQPRRAA